MVASFDSSSLSRLRTSVTSRTSNRPPVTALSWPTPVASTGMHRTNRMTSDVCSNSSITGSLVSYARRTGLSLKPSSARRMPTAFAPMPTRCSADTALGDAKRTRASSSSAITPSPTRGAALESATGPWNGNEPSAIIDANRWNMPT